MPLYRVIAKGFRNNRRYKPGQEFTGPKGLTGSWFVPATTEVAAAGGASPEPKILTLAEGGRQIGADHGEADLA